MRLDALSGGLTLDGLVRATPQPRPRVRPGESARYVALSLGKDDEDVLRTQASQLEMSVDVVVATVLELLSARALLEELGAPEAFPPSEQAHMGRPRALPPTAALQKWVGWLEGGQSPQPSTRTADDELPEVLLPDRLEPRLRQIGIDAVMRSIASDNGRLAKRCDALAAREGMTLTEWMLAGALAAISRPS